MDVIYLFVALLLLAGGVMLIFAPKAMIRFSESLNRWASTDDMILYNRHTVGAVILLIAGYMLYAYFRLYI